MNQDMPADALLVEEKKYLGQTYYPKEETATQNFSRLRWDKIHFLQKCQ
jgi:hypothetical protein